MRRSFCIMRTKTSVVLFTQMRDSNAAREAFGELGKEGVKGLGSAVGDPDKWDLENITALISKFSKRKFSVEGHIISGATLIKMCRDEARNEHQVGTFNEYNVKSKEIDSRAVTAIPQALWEEIEMTYPTMFRERKHFEWFIKHFPIFLIPERY